MLIFSRYCFFIFLEQYVEDGLCFFGENTAERCSGASPCSVSERLCHAWDGTWVFHTCAEAAALSQILHIYIFSRVWVLSDFLVVLTEHL